VNAREAHDQAVEKLASEYAAKGFRVQKEALLPFAFTRAGQATHRADLVAEREEEHHVIEVTVRGVRGEPHARRWREIAEEIRSHPGWHFQIVLVDREPPAVSGPERIAAEIANTEALLEGGNLTAAVLLAGAAFEAAAQWRLTAIGALTSSNGSTTLVERLVSEGQLEQEDFVPVRDAIELRNAVAHGSLDLPASREAVERLVDSARRLLGAT
jgi:hypothetical protein